MQSGLPGSLIFILALAKIQRAAGNFSGAKTSTSVFKQLIIVKCLRMFVSCKLWLCCVCKGNLILFWDFVFRNLKGRLPILLGDKH